MAPIIEALAGVWGTLKVELAVFVLTIAFGFVLRGVCPEMAERPSKSKPKEGSTGRGSLQRAQPRDAAPTKPWQPATSGPRSARTASAEQQPKAGRAFAPQGRAAPTVDWVIDGMREHPSVKFASGALDAYSELCEQLRRDGVCMREAALGARHTVLDFYAALVQCAVRAGRCDLVDSILDDMAQQGVQRPPWFYESTMKQLAGQSRYQLALSVYERMAADGLEPSAVTCSCLVSFAAEVGELQRAVGFFETLSSLVTPSIRAYMTVLRVHGKQRDWESSIATLREMQRRHVRVDCPVLNIVLATGVSAGRLAGAEALLVEAEGYSPPITDVVSYNTMVKLYAQSNDLGGAKALIQRMRRRGLDPNAITFNSAMDVAVRGRMAAEAWELLAEMRGAGLKPDRYTCSILVRATPHEASPPRIQQALDLLREVDGALDAPLRSTLFHSVIEAAAQTGDASATRSVLAQARECQVVPAAAAYKRLLGCAEARGTRRAPAAAAARGAAAGRAAGRAGVC